MDHLRSSWKSWAVGVACGLGVAVVIGAEAQPNRAEATGRCQMQVWSYRAEGGSAANHGAYRLDTQTGEVWSIGPGGQAVSVRFE